MVVRHGRVKRRIGFFAAGVCLTIAFILDGLQFLFTMLHALSVPAAATIIGIPLAAIGSSIAVIVPWVITVFAIIGFGLFFIFSKVRFFSGARMAPRLAGAGISLVTETIPLFNAFFSITSAVMCIILTSWKEDALASVLQAEPVPAPQRSRPQAANDNTPEASQEIPTVDKRAA